MSKQSFPLKLKVLKTFINPNMDDLKTIKFKVKKILEDFDEMNSSVYLQKKFPILKLTFVDLKLFRSKFLLTLF